MERAAGVFGGAVTPKAPGVELKALHATINAYTTKRSAIAATKYVLSNHPDPSPYLDADGKYLQRDHTIRHYRYADLNGMALADLDNSNIEVIR